MNESQRISRLLLLVLACAAVGQPCRADDETDVRATLARFVTAFDLLDWPPFTALFEDDATVCYPSPPNPAPCVEGRTAFEPAWKRVFEGIRGARTAPPYMDLKPERLRVRLIGDAAIVTFELHDLPGQTGRRTIVLHRRTDGWRIAHLHASNVPTTDAR